MEPALNNAGSSSTAHPRRGKLRAPHPITSAHRARTTRLAPPAPARPGSSSHPTTGVNGSHPTLPIKALQGTKTRRTDTVKDGWQRDVVFVTRNTPLGALMGRCRSLIMDEGYTRIRLHAMAAAIPHALLLLHALLDILPYPQGEKGMWYEIKTGTTECVDEVMSKEKGKAKAKSEAAEGDGDVSMEGANEAEIDFSNIGAVEEDEPERVSRLKASIEIDLHIGPKRQRQPETEPDKGNTSTARKVPPTIPNKRTRPSKRKREHLRRMGTGTGTGQGQPKEVKETAQVRVQEEDEDEEAAMNVMMASAKKASTSSVNRAKDKDKGKGKGGDKEILGKPSHVAVLSQEEEEEEYENM